jgi:hypothetical protein
MLGCTETNFWKKFWPELILWFIKWYIFICYFVCYQTGRHFQSSRRELANVRIKRLTITLYVRHNKVLILYIFSCVVQNSSYAIQQINLIFYLSENNKVPVTAIFFFISDPARNKTLKNWVPAGTNQPEQQKLEFQFRLELIKKHGRNRNSIYFQRDRISNVFVSNKSSQ